MRKNIFYFSKLFRKIKKTPNILLFAIIIFFMGLIVMASAMRLRQEGPVAPTAPQSKPKAYEGIPIPACTLQFSLIPTTSPPPQCLLECTSDANCPSNLKCLPVSSNPNGLRYCLNALCPVETDCVCNPSPTPISSPSPSPSPTPPEQCFSQCPKTGCPNGLVCQTIGILGDTACVNPQCPTDTDCICPLPTPSPSSTPKPTPSGIGGGQCHASCKNSSDCVEGLVCLPFGFTEALTCVNPACTQEGDCICNISSPSPTPSTNTSPSPSASPSSLASASPSSSASLQPSPTPPPECGHSCSSNAQCSNGTICINSLCLNPACSSASNCICPNPTPTPTTSVSPSPSSSSGPTPGASSSSQPSTNPSGVGNLSQIKLSLKFEGVTQLRPNKAVFFQIKNVLQDMYEIQENAILSPNDVGLYTMNESFSKPLTPGQYQVTVKGPIHLRRAYTITVQDVNQQIINLSLLRDPEYVYVGDMSGDNIVNQFDVNSFIQAYQNPIFNPNADFNFDGNLDIYDFSYFQRNYDRIGE